MIRLPPGGLTFLMPGRTPTVGHYKLIAPIAAGDRGEVYLAHDPITARNVAIKILPQRSEPARDMLARFHQEARAMAAIHHPNIVSVYDIGTAGGYTYLVMEYLEGQDLQAIIKAEAPLPLSRVLDLGVQIASGLAAAHGQGIVHRDLKPANILVSSSNEVKLLDFGWAKPPSERADTPTAADGFIIVDTLAYMSP